MAEVRRYLDAGRGLAQTAGGLRAGGSARRPVFLMDDSIENLAHITNRLGVIDPNSKFGAPVVFLRRAIGKMIGWYSRPAHEFDRAVVEMLRHLRQDMQGLQRQIEALAAEQRGHAAQGDVLRSTVELLCANIAAVRSLRSAVEENDPQIKSRIDAIAAAMEAEVADLKGALLEPGSPGDTNLNE